jgi:hypothetical protein
MNASKKRRLEKAGWKFGTAAELLGLEPAEAAYIELKVRLAVQLADLRKKMHLSQKAVAERTGSSQSRVAKMEIGDASVSLDLLVRSLLALGANAKGIESDIDQAVSSDK